MSIVQLASGPMTQLSRAGGAWISDGVRAAR
jgi:hypothetical protein